MQKNCQLKPYCSLSAAETDEITKKALNVPFLAAQCIIYPRW